jgi:hypothetical protein
MKKLLFIILVMVFAASISYAAPFLSCDPYPLTGTQPTEFAIYLDGATIPIISPAQIIDGKVILKYDLSSISAGNHTVVIKAVTVDPKWGRLESIATNPFVFQRLSNPPTPTGIGLVPQ